MENLLNALQKADNICKRVNSHFEKATQLEQSLETLNTQHKGAKRKWRLIGLASWIGIGLVGDVFSLIPGIGSILQYIFLLGGIAAGIYIAKKGYENEKVSLETQIHNIQEKAQAERAMAQKIFEENYEALSFLPNDYWYPMATSYLVKTIASKRVDSLGAALDLFDTQLHRWKIEEVNANMLAQQQAQTAYLKSISISSSINAAASVTNVLFNLAK